MIIAILAGTETSRNVTITAMSHLIKDKLSMQRTRDEIKNSMQKYCVENVLKLGHKFTGQADFEFLNRVISESMRYNPPGHHTDVYKILEDCKLGKYNFLKGQELIFSIYGAHLNPNEWHSPEKFIPDRFNPDSEFFKKPNGEPRHQHALIPFGFGERKCAGYLFAKTIIPALVTKFVHEFDFEYVEKYM